MALTHLVSTLFPAASTRGPWQIWVDRVLSAYPLLALLGGIALPAAFSVAGERSARWP